MCFLEGFFVSVRPRCFSTAHASTKKEGASGAVAGEGDRRTNYPSKEKMRTFPPPSYSILGIWEKNPRGSENKGIPAAAADIYRHIPTVKGGTWNTIIAVSFSPFEVRGKKLAR